MQLMQSFLVLGAAVSTVLGAPSYIEREKPLKGIDLRVLPLGSSSTVGEHSSKLNGYRLSLLESLQADSANVKYIGSHRNGTMKNGENEGWSGYQIEAIEAKSHLSLPKRPNLVLLAAGLNDLIFDHEEGAPGRLSCLIDTIAKECPDAVIAVAQLYTNAKQTVRDKIDTFNKAIPNIVKEQVEKKKNKVVIADLRPGFTQDDLYKDGIHPNDGGYVKYAEAWHMAILEAKMKNWITKPVDVKSQ